MPDSPACLAFAAPASRTWFKEAFPGPTDAQRLGWPPIASGRSTLLLAPTGSGKTLAAFLASIDRIMFHVPVDAPPRTRVLYVSPLKALGVDVERNLRAPLAGIRAVAQRGGEPFRYPRIGVRTGDTPARERRELVAEPPDILITTPESLYLMLTSRARETLRDVETVILDEIHAVAGSKRGTHLALSLERLEGERRLGMPDPGRGKARPRGGRDEEPPESPATDRAFALHPPPLQRIGLSATQRPLEEIARLLGGFDVVEDEGTGGGVPRPRPVEIVDARGPKVFEVTVEVPVDDMSRLGEPMDHIPSGPVAGGPTRASIWPSIHPRLLELIRQHRSTLIFVNSRRLAERLSAAVNELAGEEVALAHHGSIAPAARRDIEDRLKRGALPALVATSTLELGIDMGAIDLVVQIEAPPSVASGIQRFGRSGHGVGEVSKGVIFPKFRLDLVACAAVAEHIRKGYVESTRYPRNPLDVLAQQIVATVSTGRADVDALFRLVRSSAPFAELPRASFEGVLDLLSGRYPSDDFRDLRPRINWDRIEGTLEARRGARMVAVTSGGTIPDRGLYGVFLAGSQPSVRVGELDEEMVFESREGDVFLLGASSWRIEEIGVDRVLVTPAPGEPGKMPFWKGEGPGRPLEFGQVIGALCRELTGADEDGARGRLREAHGLDERAADNLLQLLAEQREATGVVPSDTTVVLERFTDEMGDERVAILTPFGSPVHAPWAMAVNALLRREHGLDADVMWSDDGIVFRFSAMDEPPPDELFIPDPDDLRDLVVDELAGTVLFAARFRENAARALLLPRQRPGRRMPLWLQRRRSADLLATVADHPDFPIVLETYRECLRDVFDLDGLSELLLGIRERRVRLVPVEGRRPSPFAASLLFGYVASFLYEGDAPLAERRAHALTLDHAQLMRLLGEPELRELLDPEAVLEVARQVARLDGRRPLRDADDLHDLLLDLGDMTEAAIVARGVAESALQNRSGAGAEGPAGRDTARVPSGAPAPMPISAQAPTPISGPASGPAVRVRTWLDELASARRAVRVRVAAEERWIGAEDAGRYRDALGVVPPGGLPHALLEPVAHPLEDLVARHARTHGPFLAWEVAARFGLGVAPVRDTLERLAERGRVVRGHFLPEELRGGVPRATNEEEWCDADVLRRIKGKSLARVRAQVEPVDPPALARFAEGWHGLDRPGRGPDALVEVVEQLQGAPLPASDLEGSMFPARLADYDPRDLDALGWAGEVVWRGVGALGSDDGRVALYLREHYDRLAPPPGRAEGELAARIRARLEERGAMFFPDLVSDTGAFQPELADALWDLVWAGEVTNDTLAPLRSMRTARRRRRSGRRGGRRGDRRTGGRPGTEGRWSLLPHPGGDLTGTERAAALAAQLLERHGVLTREAVRSEAAAGGFSAVYAVLKGMEEAGRLRRGYFVDGLGATQFALPGAEERLRRVRDAAEEDAPPRILSATDPANPWGAALPWPDREGRPRRAAGARVILLDGALGAWTSRSGGRVITFLPDGVPDRDRRRAADRIAEGLAALPRHMHRRALVLRTVDGRPPGESELADALRERGFRPSHKGWQVVVGRA